MACERELREILEKFEQHGIETRFAADKAAALRECMSFVSSGMTASVGGSMTIAEIGLREECEKAGVNFITVPRDIPFEERMAKLRNCAAVDVYFCGANALTRNGEIVNIDGFGNRVAASIFGPSKVVIVAGYNKIVGTLREADYRVRFIATPQNVRRLNGTAPCATLDMCVDCTSEQGRICNAAVTIENSRLNGRMVLVLVNERLGY